MRDEHPAGLEVLGATGPLQQKAGGKSRIRAESLPKFDAAHPDSDVLFGYDLINRREGEVQGSNRQTYHPDLDSFDPKRHVRGDEKSGGKQSPDAQDRKSQRDQRDGPPRRPS
jgi:hypothetical protein